MRHAYAQITSGQIYYEVEGDGETIVCLHKTPWSSWEYQKIIPLLSKDYRVIAMDSLGFGLSDPAPKEWRHIEDWANSVTEFLDTMDIGKATLVGHGTGANLAIEIAASKPDRINKMILIDYGLDTEMSNLSNKPLDPLLSQIKTSCLHDWMTMNRERDDLESLIPVDGLYLREMWNTQINGHPDLDPKGIQSAFLSSIRAYEKWCSHGSSLPVEQDYDIKGRACLVNCPALLTVETPDGPSSAVSESVKSLSNLISNVKLPR